jgi:hypothetical protein
MKGTGAMRPSSMFYVHEADVVQIHHFLDECSLCDKPLSGDIFMYRSDRTFQPSPIRVVEASSSVCVLCVCRGDTPFCSEECRQQQIEVDRAKHRRKKRAALAARREHQHRLRHHHQQPRQPRPPGMDKRRVDACYARAPALRV